MPAVLIRSLEITDLRVIEHLRIYPGKRLNFIVGANGAGKTSILEAIYLAGRGRTFRHPDAGPMIRQGADSTVVLLELEADGTTRTSSLGVRRERRQFSGRLNGKDVSRRSTLAETLPVQWIGSQPQSLLQMGPEIRRRFVDMGLFHVEHAYLSILTEFHRILRQRNAAIRQGVAEAVLPWNRPMEEAAVELNRRREAFVVDLMERAAGLLNDWGVAFVIGHRYRPGWHAERSLAEELKRKLEIDMRMSYTTLGPHRADWELLADGTNAEKKLSRGQQKILVLALNLALWDIIRERSGRPPVILIDDLASELDRQNREHVLEELEKRPVQAFIAMIEPDTDIVRQTLPTVFHVEHGAITD